ncbi:MAG: hypothetical protein WC124_02170 [Desulfoplanes sp.]
MKFDVQAARALCEKLYLPWTYDSEDCICSNNIEQELGDCGSIIGEWQEVVCEFLGEGRSTDIVRGVSLLPAALDRIEELEAAMGEIRPGDEEKLQNLVDAVELGKEFWPDDDEFESDIELLRRYQAMAAKMTEEIQ